MSGIDPRQWLEALRWIAKADEDRRGAALLLAAEPPLLDPAAYHCQQAAEKLLKAVLTAAARPVPRSHDLEYLGHLVADALPVMAMTAAALADFTPWGTATRYPDLESGMGIMPADIRDALAAIDALRNAISAIAPPNP